MSWADLPPDLLRVISGSLREVDDFVRFLSVCQAWRDAASASLPQFLPWLLAPSGNDSTPSIARFCSGSPSIARFHSIFSKTTWYAPGTYSLRNRWLATEDGTVAWSLTSEIGGPSPSLRLVHPFTGAAKSLPPFFARHTEGSSSCIPYSDGFVLADGTLVLYAIDDDALGRYGCFVVAAMLRPGDTAWIEGRACQMMKAGYSGCWAAAYHDGEIVLVDLHEADAVKLRITSGGDKVDVLDVITTSTTSRGESPPWNDLSTEHPRRIYTFKSRGELLVACLVLHTAAEQHSVHPRALAGAMSLSIYALEPEEVAGDGVDIIPRWVKRDARSLGDRVLFLGCPTSFAVDAARFGGAINGGCAYFAICSRNFSMTWLRYLPKECCVYRYSFEDGSATVVEELPTAGWNDDAHMTWLLPQLPAIAPAREIRERLVQGPKKQEGASCPRNIIRAPRTMPQFTIFVGNLPSGFACLHLNNFFAEFGKVADARIICDRRRFRSWGFGFVTMATMDEPDDVFAAMDGKYFFGHVLRVKFTEERPEGIFVMPLLAPKQLSHLNASAAAAAAAWKA